MIDLIIAASWYPGVDDPGRGRFVADQAEALRRSGRVRPLVTSFDLAPFDKGLAARPDYVSLVQRQLELALGQRTDATSPRAFGGETGVPIARLPIAEPTGGPALAAGLDAEHRAAALRLLASRLSGHSSRGVVHAHTGYPDGAAALSLAKQLGWPLVITEHASFVARQMRQPAQRRGYLAAVRYASRFIAVSEVLAGELRSAIPELEDKLLVVPNAIPIDDFTPVGLEGRTADELLFVGYRKERKGMVTLLQAFADVYEERPTATLRLLGRSTTPAEEERWHQLAFQLGVADAVHFDGPTDRAGVAHAMKSASLFVHASPRETFGIATLEALASGTPVVATRSGGISFVLEDSRLGELVPPQDSRALSRAILRALERRAEFDPGYLRRAVEPFAAGSVAGRLAEIYEEVLERWDGEPGQPMDPASVSSRQVPWEGALEPIGEVLLIAYDTRRAGQVLRLAPPDLLQRVTLLTHGDTALDELPSGIKQTVSAAPDVATALRRLGVHGPRGTIKDRLLRLARNPLGPILRRLARGGLAELRWQAARVGMSAALRRSWVATCTSDHGASEIVCLDGIDYVIGQPLLEAGVVRPVPGGLLWLADRWASAQAVESSSPSRSRIDEASRSPTTVQS